LEKIKNDARNNFLVMKWFKDVKNLNELRTLYRVLALRYHPDVGGNTISMQEINNEYDKLSKILIDSNPDFSDERKVYESEVAEDLKEKVAQVIVLPDVSVEIIGNWIWVTGNTKPVKEQLKKADFMFARKKAAWYWHRGYYRKFNRNDYDLNTIREMWGSERVEREEEEYNSALN
jgi:hypothetical protein